MTFAHPPALSDSEPVDDVLRTWFRSQVPHPWPAAPRPPEARAVRPWLRRLPPRLALAASLGLLFVGLLALAGRLAPAVSDPDAPQPTTASPRLVNPRATPARDAIPGKDAYRVRESLHQQGDLPTELRIEIIPNR